MEGTSVISPISGLAFTAMEMEGGGPEACRSEGEVKGREVGEA